LRKLKKGVSLLIKRIENVFKQSKNPFHRSITPEFHWTDYKIKVHIYCLLIGLILTYRASLQEGDGGHGKEGN